MNKNLLKDLQHEIILIEKDLVVTDEQEFAERSTTRNHLN